MRVRLAAFLAAAFFLLSAPPGQPAARSDSARQTLVRLLLGGEVKPLVDLPAGGDGVVVYFLPASGKRTDERGVDVRTLARGLKLKGVGVRAGEEADITDVRFEKDSVEIQIGAGGDGRRGITNPLRTRHTGTHGAGARISFRYRRRVSDVDIEPDRFLSFMSRLLDVGSIREKIAEQAMPAGFKSAVEQRTVKVGMTYQMVLMAFGDPGQKKINDSTIDLSETWYYLRDGHRWVVDFLNGKVVKVRIY